MATPANNKAAVDRPAARPSAADNDTPTRAPIKATTGTVPKGVTS